MQLSFDCKNEAMSYRDFEKRRRHLLYLASKKMLISVEQAAEKFGCHKRTIQRILDGLRDDGYDIRYDKNLCRFVIYNLQDLNLNMLAYFNG